MNEKERMIELTKYAYKTYKFVRKIVHEPSIFDDINFAFSKYYFYMRMLTTIYPELNREELEIEWNKEIENDKN